MEFRKKTTATLLIAILMISTFVLAIPVSATYPEYSFTTNVGDQPVSIIVVETETAVTWTIDFPGEDPYESTEGNGHWAVGLVIALDGKGPAYQIHNNDGSDHYYDFGTWLYSEWGPIEVGYYGWQTGWDGTGDREANNILVEDVDGITCTGLKHNEANPEGIFTISIDKSELGYDFHWALNLAIGSGFWGDYMVYEQMACPKATPGPSLNWATPLVDDVVKNYEYAQLAIPDPDEPVSSGLPIETNTLYPKVSFTIDPTSVTFDDVIVGTGPVSKQIMLQNTGEIAEKFTVELDYDSGGFYASYLTISDGGTYRVAPYVTWEITIPCLPGLKQRYVDLQLDVPLDASIGTFEGTLVFWATATE